MTSDYRVYKLHTGTVIDHIPAGKGIRVIRLLGFDVAKDPVTLGMNLESKKLGKKDVVKVEERFLTQKEMDSLCIVAPQATVNLLKDHVVTEKHIVESPTELIGVATCPNPNCVTNNQDEDGFFDLHGTAYRCRFCERMYHPEELSVEGFSTKE